MVKFPLTLKWGWLCSDIELPMQRIITPKIRYLGALSVTKIMISFSKWVWSLGNVMEFTVKEKQKLEFCHFV